MKHYEFKITQKVVDKNSSRVDYILLNREQLGELLTQIEQVLTKEINNEK